MLSLSLSISHTHTHIHTHTQSHCWTVETHPELHQEESVLRSFAKQLFQSPLLLRELVINLTDVHGLKKGVAVRVIRLTDVHKEVLIVLRTQGADRETKTLMC